MVRNPIVINCNQLHIGVQSVQQNRVLYKGRAPLILWAETLANASLFVSVSQFQNSNIALRREPLLAFSEVNRVLTRMRKNRLVLTKSRKTCIALISCILVALIPLPRLFWPKKNGVLLWCFAQNISWNKDANSSYIILCPDHVYPLPPDITKKQSKSHNKQMRLIIQNKNNRLTFGHWATEKYRWTTLLTTLHFYIPNLFGVTSGDD